MLNLTATRALRNTARPRTRSRRCRSTATGRDGRLRQHRLRVRERLRLSDGADW